MTADPIVSVRDLRFAYPGSRAFALDDVTLEIARGSTLALVGQNGSGKTTLTKHLNGLLRPTSGRVLVDGLDTSLEPVRALARRVGYVFQNPGHQLFARTVAEELAFGPRNLGLPAELVEERVAQTAAGLGLGDLLGVHPHRLPWPARKVVSIASVLTMRPALLVLDEPTTGQDHRTRRRIVDLIGSLRDDGVSIVCVTHDMPLVAEVADRLAVLTQGRVAADGAPRDLLSDRALLASTRLRPPQITELSLALRGAAAGPAALSIDELAAEIRAAS